MSRSQVLRHAWVHAPGVLLACAVPFTATRGAVADPGTAAVSGTAASAQGGSVAGQLEEVTITRKSAPRTSRTFRSACPRSRVVNWQSTTSPTITTSCARCRALRSRQARGPDSTTSRSRGVSSTSGSATVGIYTNKDSVTVSNTQYDGAVQPKLFDLDRIEVLRGPQGTLYGASSMGGTIRFITKQPDLSAFSAAVSTDLSDTHHGGFNNDEYAILNIPVIEGVFALRVGVELASESGYIDHYRAGIERT